ncbi:MAG: ATP-binding cassette domain-containing protein [Clostridia bacterium]|nr:ATP-binding cassette domain-containing protein [Clostridia bacterium]
MIEFVNVVKKYPNGTVAINELSFSVDDGEVVFIHGKTDSGKTTLRKLMLLEERVTSGDIYFDDIPISRIRTGKIYRHRRKIGVVFRESRLFVHKTLYDNLIFVLRAVDYRGKALKERARKLLELAGLWEERKKYPEMLTPTERQRAEIARALATDPKIIIADEPTASLDTKGGLEILGMLMKLNSEGKTVIIFTKDEELSQQFGKRMITLDFGEVVSDTAPTVSEKEETENSETEYNTENEPSEETKDDVDGSEK